jgi:ribosomal protein L12E/L44/L45/RPP1/RPP2
MENIYAALLLHKVGGEITESTLEKVLKAAGATVDKNQLSKLVAGLKDANIDTIINSAAAVPMVATPAVSAGAPKSESKKEEKEKKKKEEEADVEPTGIGSLF